jgi:transposase InsO family protein
MTSQPERERLIFLINEAKQSGARLGIACDTACITLRTYHRWFKDNEVMSDQRSEVERPAPKNKLSEHEQQNILNVCNQPEYASLPPSQIVPTLLDKGLYIASEASFYRILKAHGQLNRRGKAQPNTHKSKPKSFEATGPNEVWTWDITYLASTIKGQFFYLYMFEDIFSRKIVGYEVHENECGTKAAQLMQRNILKEQCFKADLVLHSDNGAPMKSATLKAKMEELGVQSSFSRPSVSNDNPYSESTFRTLKYRPNWPSAGFKTLEEARDWVHEFVDWYNNKHKHSKINFVTPAERHEGKDVEILNNRKAILKAAKEKNPIRWSKDIRNCEPIGSVMLNPDKVETTIEEKAA